MEFSLDTEQEILRESVRSFAENEIKPVARELDDDATDAVAGDGWRVR